MSNLNLTRFQKAYMNGESIREAAGDVEYEKQFKINDSCRKLHDFLDKSVYIREQRHPESNIINQGVGSYCVPVGGQDEFFRLYDNCRQSGVHLCFTERQYFTLPGGEQLTHSGIMLDFDIYQRDSVVQVNDMHYQHLMEEIFQKLMELIDMSIEDGKHISVKETYVCIIRKPDLALIDNHAEFGNCYKDGFHMLIPGIQVSKGLKKFLRRKILEARVLETVFADCKFLNSWDDILDANATSVPVFFIGGGKKGKPIYKVDKIYRVRGRTDSSQIFINEEHAFYEDANVPQEFSLTCPSKYIKKMEFEPRPLYQDQIQMMAEKTENDLLDMEEIIENENDLSILTMHDPEANKIKQAFTIINRERLNTYSSWRDAMIMLANEGEQYKPIAIWASQRVPHAFIKDGLKTIDKLFDQFANQPPIEGVRPLTIRTLFKWAEEDNPEKYREMLDNSAFKVLLGIVLDNMGDIEDSDVAKVLHIMFDKKFLSVLDSTGDSDDRYWYEFVMPGDNMADGEVFKYRREKFPDNLALYMSQKMPNFFKQINDWIRDKAEQAAADANKAKYYQEVRKNFKQSSKKLRRDGFQRQVIRQAQLMFRDRNFLAKLDKDPNILGVYNGVLLLTPDKVKLIARFHEYPVSKFTKVNFVPYNAEDPCVKALESAIREMFPPDEMDAHEFIMCYFASTLDANAKEAMLFAFFGGGSNGKSFIMELHRRTLGDCYGKKLGITFLTRPPPSADKPNDALMQLEGARYVYFSESAEGVMLQMESVKEYTGGESLYGRRLRKEGQMFEPHCHYNIASNHELGIVGIDHGTWRRIRAYWFKIKFCKDPDPENPFEKKANPNYIKVYKKSPKWQQAWLAILSKYYVIFHKKYGGNLWNIPCRTIEKETQEYRNRQDTINRFITERVRYDPNAAEAPMERLTNAYRDWYMANINARDRIVPREALEKFNNSSIAKYISKRSAGQYLQYHLILKAEEVQRYDEEARRLANGGGPIPTEDEEGDVLARMQAKLMARDHQHGGSGQTQFSGE